MRMWCPQQLANRLSFVSVVPWLGLAPHQPASAACLLSACLLPLPPVWCGGQAPLLVDQGLLRSMEHALWRDTSFLAGLGVMDYSLLVGE